MKLLGSEGFATRSDLPRGRHLVTAQQLSAHLHTHLHTQQHPMSGSTPWRIVEVGCSAHAAYLDEHIPGALYLDTGHLEAPPLWNKVSDPALLHVLLRLGIRHDTTVLLVGRPLLAAARAAHLMLYAGVRDVRLLDGGFDAWLQAGYPCEAGALSAAAQQPRPATPAMPAGFGATFPGCPQFLIDLPQAKARLQRPDGALVSIRSWSEFSGATSGYSYIAAKGDIPGALWGHADPAARNGPTNLHPDVNDMGAFHTPYGCMLPAADIARMWHSEGIGPHQQQIAFYCGTGWRASLAFFYAWLMGWERISVFDGGWLEWSQASNIDAKLLQKTL